MHHAECTLSPTEPSLAAIPPADLPTKLISVAGRCCPVMFLAPFGDLLDDSQLDCLFPVLTCCSILFGGMFPPPNPPLFEKKSLSKCCKQQVYSISVFFYHFFFPEKGR